jgi:GTPase SAR1 family protein
MANGEGFALVYSIISNLSFTEIEKIRNGIAKHKNSEKVPMVLVGNKKDLGISDIFLSNSLLRLNLLEAKREVPIEKARAVSKEWGCDFIEASAKTDTNIREIFFSLIDQVWQLNGPPKANKERNYGKYCTLF